MSRDQPNSRFHGRDIFREIGRLPWKTPISVKSVIFNAFTFIYEGFGSNKIVITVKMWRAFDRN